MTDITKTGNDNENNDDNVSTEDNADTVNKETTEETAPKGEKTFTQKELNKLVKERVARVEADEAKKWAEKFADYDELKEAATALSKKEEELNDISSKYESTSAERDRLKIAREFGFGDDELDLLNGTSYEDLKESAEKLIKVIGKPKAVNTANQSKQYVGSIAPKPKSPAQLLAERAVAEAK